MSLKNRYPEHKSFLISKRSLFIISIALAVMSFVAMALIATLFFALSALVLVPEILLFLPKKYPLLEDIRIRKVMFIGFWIIGFSCCQMQNDFNKSKTANSFNADEAISNISSYVSQKNTEPIFQNLDTLMLIYDYGYYDYETAWDFKPELITIDNAHKTITYHPFDADSLDTKPYLKAISNYGMLTDYSLLFQLDDFNQVKSVQAIASFGKEKQIWIDSFWNEKQNISRYIIQSKISKLRKVAKNMTEQKDHAALVENFKEKYITGLDESYQPLKQYVKENMNDPDSYEHIQTVWKDMNSYIEVAMKYREKNEFGGTVIMYVTAKVNYDGTLNEVENFNP